MSMPQRYEVLGEAVARRPEGPVWKVRDRESGATLLLKEIEGGPLRDRAVLLGFVGDVREAARLDHPGIARPLDVEVKGGRCWLTQQLPPGVPLTRVLADPGLTDLSSEDLARCILETGSEVLERSLASAPHGTLRPESVWVTADGQVVFTDFGVAGLGLGRDRYTAPEQGRSGGTPTAASEQYALGCIVHQVLTGEPSGPRPAPVRSLAKVDRRLARAVDRMLAASPADRFADFAALRAGIARRPLRAGFGFGAAAAVLLGLLVGALDLWAPHLLPWHEHEPATPAVEVHPTGMHPDLARRLVRVHERVHELAMPGLADELARAAERLRGGEAPAHPGTDMASVVEDAARRASEDAVERMDRLALEAEGRRDVEASHRLEIQERSAELERLLSWAAPAEVDGLQRELARTEQWRFRVAHVSARLTEEVFQTDAWRRALALRAEARSLLEAGRFDQVLDRARDGVLLFEAARDRLAAIPPSTEPEVQPLSSPLAGGLPGPLDPPVLAEIPPDELRRGLEPPEPGAEEPEEPAPPLPPELEDDYADVQEALRRVVARLDAVIEVHGDGTWTLLLRAGEDRIHMAGTWRRTDEGVELAVLTVDRQRAVHRAVVVIRFVEGRPQGIDRLFRRVPEVLAWMLRSLGERLGSGSYPEWFPASFVPSGTEYTLPIIDLASPLPGAASNTGRFEASGIVGAPGAPRLSLQGGHVPLQGNRFRGTAHLGGSGRDTLELAYVAARHFGSARVRSVVIDRTPPQVGLVSPAAGEKLLPGSVVPVLGHAFDANLAGVTVNGKPAVLSKTGGLDTFSLSLPLPEEGSLGIVVEATDKAGNVTTLQRRTEHEAKSVLPIRLRTPRQGELVAYRRVEVEGWVPEQSARATLRVNGQHAEVDANGFFASWVEAVDEGPFEISATYGGPDVVEQNVTVEVVVDTEPPLLEITAPDDGLVTDRDRVTIRGRMTDEHPDAVVVTDRAWRVRRDGTFSRSVDLVPGTNEIELFARDAAGNASDAHTVSIVYEPPPEEVSAPRILQPRPGEIVGLGPVVVVGRVAKEVEGSYVTLNGERVDLDGVRFEGSIQADAEGNLTITVRHEGERVVPREKSVSVVVDANPPTVEIQDPSPETTEVFSTRLRVRGRVSDLSVKRLWIEVGGRRGRLSFDRRTGRFQTTVTLPLDVPTQIRVVAQDGVGYEGTDERTVTARASQVLQPPYQPGPPVAPPPGAGPLPPGRQAAYYDVQVQSVQHFWMPVPDDVVSGLRGRATWQVLTPQVVQMLAQGRLDTPFRVKVVITATFSTNVIGSSVRLGRRTLHQGPGAFRHELSGTFPAPSRRLRARQPVFPQTTRLLRFDIVDAGRVVQQVSRTIPIVPSIAGGRRWR